MERWSIGEITVTKVVEIEGWNTIEEWARTMPACTLAAVDEVTWLRPTYRHGDTINMSVHALLVETPDRKIVVDLGIGNGKPRGWEPADDLDTDFLDRVEKIWPRDEVDTVICTHLHVDHVGWNTVRVDDRWVPTFPNARYCFVRDEHDYWVSYGEDESVRASYTDYAEQILDGPTVYADSIKPILDAGQVEWVAAGDVVAPGISLLATPGHTPGHVSVLIESAGETAVITGDVFHSPAQVTRSEWTVLMDATPGDAIASRQGLLERYADTPTIVIGSHFGTPSGNHIERDGDSFRLVPIDVPVDVPVDAVPPPG